MKKLAILYSTYTPTIDSIIGFLGKEVEIVCFNNNFDETDKFDLIVNINSEYRGNALKAHHSLLPSFEGENPVQQAVLAGVKVSGVTFYFTNPFRIIAQYPIFISNDAHFDDIEQELEYIEQGIFPIIIQKLLNNEIIEMKTLLNKNCTGCSGGNCCGR